MQHDNIPHWFCKPWFPAVPSFPGFPGTARCPAAFSVAGGEIGKVTTALRAQVLLGVVFGGYYFQEKFLASRVIGAIVLTIGLILVALPRGEKE